MAEQQTPVVRRVALKVIKPGMDSHAVIARFEAERQALALMNHPNIAHILDGGITESGRPYFVMELVNGLAITEYCDKNDLSTEERLSLFIEVCRAVQHAHQKGIIHRDLKPRNIMVTLHDGKPVPKVIDFGVSKAIHQRLTEKTLFTAYGTMIGTPEYMSPEQAEMSGLDVDTRSDVYSLGVVLYELLTGSTPLEADSLREAGYAEIQRMIKDTEAPKPSVRLSTSGAKLTAIAKHRSIDPNGLQKLVRGDLDWIVMKSLEKERARRYDTASDFAVDIQRFLAGKAVEAHPPSPVYRMRKFVRRRKSLVAAVAAVTAALVVGLLGTTAALVVALHLKEDAVNANDRLARALENAENARRQKERAEFQARLRWYFSDMNRAARAAEDFNFDLTTRLLRLHQPETSEQDLRGFEWYFLWGLCQPGLAVRRENVGRHILSGVLSADGRFLAVVGWRGGAIIDLHRTSGLGPVEFSENAMLDAVFSPDGSLLIACGQHKIFVWRTESLVVQGVKCAPLAIMDHGQVFRLAISPNGQLLASGSRTAVENVKLWDLPSKESTGEEGAADLVGHSNNIQFLTFSPDGTLLAAGDWDAKVSIWHHSPDDPRGGWTRKVFLDMDAGPPWSAMFSPDSKTLVTCAESVKLWDVSSGKELGNVRGSSAARLAQYTPDGTCLVTGHADGTV